MQNVIIKGRDNPVRLVFSFTGDVSLATFSSITIGLGDELYTSGDGFLSVDGDELTLKIGDTTALQPGSYYPEIVGYSTQFDDGFLLTGEKLKVLANSITVR
jgi:hypothetical protein